MAAGQGQLISLASIQTFSITRTEPPLKVKEKAQIKGEMISLYGITPVIGRERDENDGLEKDVRLVSAMR